MSNSEDAKKYNENLDKLLKETKILTMELFEKFYDAYSYDAPTTHSWLINKLKIIKERLEKGDTLIVENSKLVLNKDNFLEWVESEFPGCIDM
jgi:hypothetical protein